MTLRGTAPAPWDMAQQTQMLTPSLVSDALTAMEITRSRHTDEHLAAARHIVTSAAVMGRRDLELRAELVIADVEARTGILPHAGATLAAINEQASAAGYHYVLARCHFLQSIADHSMGDLPSARIHGVRSVELLPDDARPEVWIDHLIMLALTYGPGPEADRYYRQALDLTAMIGDIDKTIGIHNNLAYTSWEVGDQPSALAHVDKMLSLAALRNVPLKASALDTVARVYIEAGRYRDAIEILAPVVGAESPVHPRGSGVLHTEPYALPECLLTLAAAHRMLGDFEEATRHIDRAAELAQQRNLRQTATSVLRARADVFAEQGDWKRAYEQHIDFHERATHLYSEEQEARARTVQAGYEADERARDSARFRELAIRDALTGLYNRRFIDEQLAALTAQSVSRRTALSAAIADADFFKRVNDEYSHEVGDRVLQAIAHILQGAVVAPETVGRLGGEEFVILMPGCTAQEVLDRCEEVRLAIDRFDWKPLVGDISMTVSIGVTTAENGQTSPSALLSDADRNLYRAKRSGRNRVVSDAR